MTWIGTVKTGNRAINGPGHNPPNPHPTPKQAAPIINLASIAELAGLNSLFPNNDYPFFFIMYVKTTKLTANPNPKTKANAGFQPSMSIKNPSILGRYVIPAIINPPAKRIPTQKTITKSLICFYL